MRIITLSSTSLPGRADSVRLTLPYPTSVNRIWRSDRGRVHKSNEYKSWLKEANVAWLLQKRDLPVKRIKGRYTLEVVVHPPDNRQRDLGNLEKAISDFLQMVDIIENDCLAKRIVFEWEESCLTNEYSSACVGIFLTVTPYL